MACGGVRCAPQGEQSLTVVTPRLLLNVLACSSSSQRHSSGDQRFRCPRPSSVSRALWGLCATACMDRRCGTPGGACLSFHSPICSGGSTHGRVHRGNPEKHARECALQEAHHIRDRLKGERAFSGRKRALEKCTLLGI